MNPERCDRVLSDLERLRQQKRFQIAGYVVMPEHVHILIGEPEVGDPSTIVQLLKQRTASIFNRESKSAAHRFWQPRFYDFNVFTHKKRVEKIRYMHNNPVVRGLVEHAKDWKWSSYGFYHGEPNGPVKIDPT